MRFHTQSRMDLVHTDQRLCSSCLPLLNPSVFLCHSSSQAVPRQNHKVPNTQVSVSPLPRVLQSQPCSNRNGQWVGSAAGEASAPVGSPSLQGPGQHRGHSCCRARPWLAWLPVHGDKVLSVRAQHVVTAHVHTDHRTQALACGQAGTKATLTEEIFFSQRWILTHITLQPQEQRS